MWMGRSLTISFVNADKPIKKITKFYVGEISGSHGNDYEDDCLFAFMIEEQIPRKHRRTSTRLHGATSQKTAV
jgi:hypothetical protein